MLRNWKHWAAATATSVILLASSGCVTHSTVVVPVALQELDDAHPGSRMTLHMTDGSSQAISFKTLTDTSIETYGPSYALADIESITQKRRSTHGHPAGDHAWAELLGAILVPRRP